MGQSRPRLTLLRYGAAYAHHNQPDGRVENRRNQLARPSRAGVPAAWGIREPPHRGA